MPTMTATKATRRHHTAAELATLDELIRRMLDGTAKEIAKAASDCVKLPFTDRSVHKRRQALGLSGTTRIKRRGPRGLAMDDLIMANPTLGPAELMVLAAAAGLSVIYRTMSARRLFLGGEPIVPGADARESREPDLNAADEAVIDKRTVTLRRAALVATLDKRAARVRGNLVARMLVNWRAGGLGEPAPATSRYVGPDPTKTRLSAEVESYIADWRAARALRRADAAVEGAA